jgi:hypothetical protein
MTGESSPAVNLTVPRRPVRTFVRDGREVYADTGRAVDEPLGSHLVLWIVEDADAWADHIIRESEAELQRWPKAQRYIGEHRLQEARESAARIRAAGPERSWRSVHHDPARAEAGAAELRRSHPNPGVRYEVVPLTGAAACPTCHQPLIEADGQWRHHRLRYAADCQPESPRTPLTTGDEWDGEWEPGEIGEGQPAATTAAGSPSGEVTTIDAHRAFLAQVAGHLNEVAGNIEQAQIQAGQRRVPQVVLDAGAQVQEAVEVAAARAGAALVALNSVLAAAEEAVKALDRATRADYLRGEAATGLGVSGR